MSRAPKRAMTRTLGLLALLAVFARGPALAQPAPTPPAPAGKVQIVATQFGLFTGGGAAPPSFVPSTLVPFKPGQNYGWFAIVRTDSPVVHWREEFTLPTPPKTWGAKDKAGPRNVSADGRTSTTDGQSTPQGGVIAHAWSVLPDDPTGHYVIRLYVEGELVKVFEFEVMDVP